MQGVNLLEVAHWSCCHCEPTFFLGEAIQAFIL